MAMTAEKARELRARLGEVLEPLYQARTGELVPLAAVALAIARLHQLDQALLCAQTAGAGRPDHPSQDP